MRSAPLPWTILRVGINVIETTAAPREEEVAARMESDEDEEDGTERKNEVVEIEPRSAPAKSAAKEPAEEPTTLCACTSAKWPR